MIRSTILFNTNDNKPLIWGGAGSGIVGQYSLATSYNKNNVCGPIFVADADQISIFLSQTNGAAAATDVYAVRIFWGITPAGTQAPPSYTGLANNPNSLPMQYAVAGAASNGIQPFTMNTIEYQIPVISATKEAFGLITVPVIGPQFQYVVYKQTGAVVNTETVSTVVVPIVYGGGGNGFGPGAG